MTNLEIRQALAALGDLAAIRLCAGLTQEQVAAAAGATDYRQVGAWENGRRTPRGARGVRYARLMARLAREWPPP